MASPNRRKVDENGTYLPCRGYTIVAHIIHPLPDQLDQITERLMNSQLKEYFAFLPKTSYHVTINPLNDVRKHHLPDLIEEQKHLQENDTSLTCTALKLRQTGVLSIKVEFNVEAEDFQRKINLARSNKL